MSWGCRSRRIVSHSGNRWRVSLLCELFGVSSGCLPLWTASHMYHTERVSPLYAPAGVPRHWTAQGIPFHSTYKRNFSAYLCPCALVVAAQQKKAQAELSWTSFGESQWNMRGLLYLRSLSESFRAYWRGLMLRFGFASEWQLDSIFPLLSLVPLLHLHF